MLQQKVLRIIIIILTLKWIICQEQQYKRVKRSCLLISPEKRKCFLPNKNDKCCSNCEDSLIDCSSVSRNRQTFFLMKFIDCPNGVKECQILNYESILKSYWIQQFFNSEEDIEILQNLIEFKAISCEDDYFLLGNMCIKRNNCRQVGVFNEIIYCKDCDEGYSLTTNPQESCQKCIVNAYKNNSNFFEIYESYTHCSYCISKDTCLLCNFGFTLIYDLNHNKMVCKQCQENCQCTENKSCTDCIDGSFYRQILPYKNENSSNNQKNPQSEYIDKNKGEFSNTDSSIKCVSCIQYVESKLGPNLKEWLNSYNIPTSQIIDTCNALDLDNIQQKNINIQDIIEQKLVLKIYKHNNMLESCCKGCAECILSQSKQILICTLCMNGYYLDQTTPRHTCKLCSEYNSDYVLCHGQKYDVTASRVYPTQCQTRFIQPIQNVSSTSSIYLDCSIQPMCQIADKWTNDNRISKGSCKRCLPGYHKERIKSNNNYYTCVQNNQSSISKDQCNQLFYYDQQQEICIPCPPNCLKCNHEGCIACDISKTYTKIISQYIVQCILLNQQTSDIKYCKTFRQGSLEDEQKRPLEGYCMQCLDGFQAVYKKIQGFNQIIECKKIIENCMKGIEDIKKGIPYKCIQCEFGYYLNNNNGCSAITNNCALFDVYLQKCQNCKYGYKLIRNECILCTNLNSINQNGYFKCLSVQEEIKLMDISQIYSLV